MVPNSTVLPKILQSRTLDDFDLFKPEDLEEFRRAISFTSPRLAEALGWSLRKYQRAMETAREETGYLPRDMALAIRGIGSVLMGTKVEGHAATPAERHCDELPHQAPSRPSDYFNGVHYADVLPDILGKTDRWLLETTQCALRVVAMRATEGITMTYGELRENARDAGIVGWDRPPTAYGRPLTSMGEVLIELARRSKKPVPLLPVIVVNKSGEAGLGFDALARKYFLSRPDKPSNWQDSQTLRLRIERSTILKELQEEVFAFGHWREVLESLAVSSRLGDAPHAG